MFVAQDGLVATKDGLRPVRISDRAVIRRLDRDESSGYAVARYVLAPGQRAWNPRNGEPSSRGFRDTDLVGPGTVVYERFFGEVTVRFL